MVRKVQVAYSFTYALSSIRLAIIRRTLDLLILIQEPLIIVVEAGEHKFATLTP